MTDTIDARDYYLITFWSDLPRKNYAAPKVRRDIREFLESQGVQTIHIKHDKLEQLEKDLKVHQQISREGKKLFGTILQYPLKPVINVTRNSSDIPFKALELIHKISDHKITLVHDIKSIQSSIFGKSPSNSQLTETYDLELKLMLESDSIIAHSVPMIDYLSSYFNIPHKKMFSLNIFDYKGLPFVPKLRNGKTSNIAFAGYLGISKKKLLDMLYSELPKNPNLNYNVYGSDFPRDFYQRSDITYNGSVNPNILPQILNENNDFGLLWDEFNPLQKDYYRMIAPHKCSLYIRSLLPLIVPSNTYIGEFVELNKIGITIDNLCDIETVDFKNLQIDFEKLKEIQKKLDAGYFTMSAINRALR
ncbi:hypothetical protein GOV04_00660 [Candidatus Woesearchaeota archaeon]|nr:hypothetical protein [Candidatus Woesearchaeota archaeon]